MEVVNLSGQMPWPPAALCMGRGSGVWHGVDEPDSIPNTQRGGRPGTQGFTGTCRKCLLQVIDCSGDCHHWHWITDLVIEEAP